MISEIEKYYCNWTEFKKLSKAEGISIKDEIWWTFWTRGYTQAVKDKNGRGKDVKLEDKQ